MPRPRSIRPAVTALVAAAFAVPVPAAAHERASSGAAVAPETPAVGSLTCATGERRSCPRGEFLAIRGEGLRTVDAVVFVGGRGSSDNRTAPPRKRSPHRVLLQVPRDAQSGRLRVVSRAARAATTSRRLEVIGNDSPSQLVATDGVSPSAARIGSGPRRTASAAAEATRARTSSPVAARRSWPLSVEK
jgi:hypothetical protein